MIIIFYVVAGVILLFGFVVLFGAPYVPVLPVQQKTALDLLALKPSQTLLELGCGDGKVLVAAGERGLRVIGYELNPILVSISWLRTRKYRDNVRVVWGNYWTKDWPVTDGIFAFLLDKYMKKLDTKIVQQYSSKKVKLASVAFEIPDRKASKIKNGVFLYEY